MATGRLDLVDKPRDEDVTPGQPPASTVRKALLGTDEGTLLDIAEAAHVVANALETAYARHRSPTREALAVYIEVLRKGLTS